MTAGLTEALDTLAAAAREQPDPELPDMNRIRALVAKRRADREALLTGTFADQHSYRHLEIHPVMRFDPLYGMILVLCVEIGRPGRESSYTLTAASASRLQGIIDDLLAGNYDPPEVSLSGRSLWLNWQNI